MAVQTIAEAAMVVRADFSKAGAEVRSQGRSIGKAIGVETAGAFITNFSGAVSRGAGRLGNVMQHVAATFFVGDFIRRIATFGLKTAASLEQAQIGFETLLGSGKKAQAFLGQLQKFAASTPFTLPGLIESSRTLIGVGVSAKDSIPLLRAFGDAAGAVGLGQEQFQRIMIATSQAIGAGKFQTADLNQIMNNGLPVWSILSKAMHKPVPVLREMASAGKLLSKDVLPVLQKQMEKDYGGAMARQSKTLAGVWSTLTDTISIGLGAALKPLLPMLSEAIPKAADFFSRALKVASGFIGQLAEGFKAGVYEGEGLSGFLGRVGAVMSQFIKGFQGGKTAVEGVETPMSKFGNIINKVILPFLHEVFTELVDHLIPALVRLAANGFGVIAPIVYAVAATLHGVLIPSMTALANVLNSNQALTRNLAIAIGIIVGATKVWDLAVKVSELGMKLWGFTLGKNGLLVKGWSALLWLAEAPLHAQNAAMAIGNSLFVTRVRVMAIDFAAWVRSTAATVANTVALVASRVAIIATTVATKAWEAAQWALTAAMDANPIGAILALITLLVAGVIYAYKHFAWFRTIVDGAWKGIQAAAMAVWNWMSKTLWPSLKRAVDQAGAAFRWWHDTVNNVMTGIAIYILSKWNQIKNTFNQLKNFIMVTLPNAFKAGVAAIGRWWDGLKAKALVPVKFVVNTVINPFLSGFQKIAGMFGVKTPGPITGFAEGGRIEGAPSSRDNRIAWLRNGAGKVISNIQVATGEFVVNARDTAKALPLLHWINAGMKGGPADITRRLGRRPVDRMGDGSEGYAFADGGFVGFFKDIWGALSNPAKLIKQPFEAALSKIPGSGMIKDLLVGMGKKLIGGFLSFISGGGVGVGGALNVVKAQVFARSQVGKPYVWASAGPGGYDCSGIVSAVYNVLKGKNPYSHTFSTESLPGPWFRQGQRVGPLVAGWSHPGQRSASAGVGHMAGLIGGLPFESTGSRGVHVGYPASTPVTSFANIGAALARGGRVELQKINRVAKADFGAVTLTPGANLIYNHTGRPEPMETARPGPGGGRMHPDDIDALAQAIGSVLAAGLLGTVPAAQNAARQIGKRPR